MSRERRRKKTRPTASNETVKEAFHDLLHRIDPENHRPAIQPGRRGESISGYDCSVDLPLCEGEETGTAGEFTVCVLFPPERCEVWLFFEADETYRPHHPVASYAYDDPNLVEKLFRRLEALGLEINIDFWTQVSLISLPVG